MGLSDYRVDPGQWTLEVSGNIRNPFRLRYSEILQAPPIERDVLLICPGVFANNGRWKGLSIRRLLDRAEPVSKVGEVTVAGPEGRYRRSRSFPVEDIRSDRVFLAYGVNGETLPQKHGFPLRTVAEGFYGYDWIKYVDEIRIG